MSFDIRHLKPDELEQLQAIRQVAYGMTDDLSNPVVRQRHEQRLPFVKGVFVDDKLAATATMLPFDMYHGAKAINVAGLASVATAAEHRRRGYIRALLHHELERLHQEGVGFCLEYPFDTRYYAKFGWQTIPSGTTINLPSDHLLSQRRPEVIKLSINDSNALQPIYQRWAQHYNFTMLRNSSFQDTWRSLVRRPWEQQERFIYLLDGAYCMLRLTHDRTSGVDTFVVYDYAFEHPEGRLNLLAFVGSLAGQVQRINIHLGDDPILLDKQAFQVANHHPLQARVVDVKACLQTLASEQQVQFTMQIHDDFCSWNEGTYLVTLGPDVREVETTDRAADINLDIRSLALILAGGISTERALQFGLIRGDYQAAQQLASLAGGRISFQARGDVF